MYVRYSGNHLQLTACLSLQQAGHQIAPTAPSVPWTSCGCWMGGRSWLRKKSREVTMKIQHSLPASFPLAPALPVSGELWFPHPRGRQERFLAVPMPHRGQREPELGQHLCSDIVPFPTSAKTHLCSPSGRRLFLFSFCSGKSCGWTHSWGQLGGAPGTVPQLGRGVPVAAAGLGQSCLTREKRWLGVQLTPCPFLLHRTPQGAKRAWVTHLELSCLRVIESLSALGSVTECWCSS